MSTPDDPQDLVPEATTAEALASALLDGEATPADEARAGAPEVVRARAAFERVAAAVASPVEADEVARERAIAAALAATEPALATTQPVDELARRRAARRGLRVAGIAAAVVGAVSLVGLAAVRSGSSGDDDSAATAAAEADADVGGDSADRSFAEDSAGTGSAAGSSNDSMLAFALVDLGSYDDVDALVSDASSTFDSTAPPTTVASQSDESAADVTSSAPAPASGGASAGCATPTPPTGEVVSSYTATLEGRPVVVVVADGPDGRVVQVYDASTCAVVFEGQP